MEAGAAFTAYMDLDDVLRQVLPYAAESANAEWSAVMLHDPEAHELVVAAAGGFDGALRVLADWDLWIRLGRNGPPACAPDPLVAYRGSR